MLPAGRLREPISGSRRADIILVTKCPDSLTAAQADAIRTLLSPRPEQSLYFTTMTYGAPYALFTEQAVPSLTDKALLVVSGIAHPAPLLHYLSAQGAQVKSLNYPDHHRFSVRDAEHIDHDRERRSSPTPFTRSERRNTQSFARSAHHGTLLVRERRGLCARSP